MTRAFAWAESLIHHESRGPGDYNNAMHRVAERLKISFHTIWALRYRKPKRVSSKVYFALEKAFAEQLKREFTKLENDCSTKGKQVPLVAEALRNSMIREDERGRDKDELR